MYLDHLDGLGYFRFGFRVTEKNGKTRAKGSQLLMLSHRSERMFL